MKIKYRIELPKLLIELGLPKTGVEVGTAESNFSCELLNNGLDKLYSVDAWTTLNQTGDGGFEDSWHQNNYKYTVERLSKYGNRSVILRGLSKDMANGILDNSLGLVYLDGDHSYDGVMSDLLNYYPKLVEGGVMAGHDYFSDAYGVKYAVRDFVNERFEIHIIEENHIDDAGFYFIKKTT